MKHTTKLSSLLLATMATVGFALSASAQSTNVAVPEPESAESTFGLLGARYSSVNFHYAALDNGPPSAGRGFGFEYNQPLQTGLDLNLGYDWSRASTDSFRFTHESLMGGVTVYSKVDWGKPFVQALAGWEWQRGVTPSGNSFGFTLGTGVELQLAQRFVLTPYFNYVRSTGFNRTEYDYGVKGTYRINRQWGATVGVQYESVYHAKDATQYLLGVNYHF